MADKKIESFKKFLKPPNITDLAERGGLRRDSPDAVPYVLGAHNGQLFIAASGNMTASVSAYSIGGFGKLVEDSRCFCVKFSESDPALVAEKFPMFGFMGRQWVADQIVAKRNETDTQEAAREVYREIERHVPELRKWPPPECDTRPYQVKQGELVDRYHENLQKMSQWSRPTPRSESELRQQFPDFEIWTVMDKLSPPMRRELFNVGAVERSIGSASAEQLFDCIGSIFSCSGSTVQGWWKKYRDHYGLKRPRRKSADHS